MILSHTQRPRNVDAPRAAAILYGDWGTSKAYVIGLAFAVAGYASFWLILPMCVLVALVGLNYIVICRHYPDGGGVYASVRHRSEIISLVGAFLLIADYLVTAAISALAAFQYLGVPNPEKFAALAILVIGAINFFGPRQSGGLAFLVSIPALIVVVLLAGFTMPHLGEAVRNLQPLQGSLMADWSGFVAIVLALSGVEAIANATGVMKLDRGSSDARPSVSRTSTPAIIWVMIEVCVFTALLALGMHALPGLQLQGGEVNAPGAEGVRDYMLRYMGEIFVGHSFGAGVGMIAGQIISVVFGLLLLSAVNTAIVDLVAITYLMSRDREVPAQFQSLNRFGVPVLGLIFAAVIPALLVVVVKDMAGLAELYAVGVVGAIATNLGATSTDKGLRLARWERGLMFLTFAVMLAIEISLLIDKPNARTFAMTILAIGLILRGLATERAQKKAAAALGGAEAPPAKAAAPVAETIETSKPPIVSAVSFPGETLDFAIEHARETQRPLYVLFVREQPALSPGDHKRKWEEDGDARLIFDYAAQKADGHRVVPCYAVSDSVADTIADVTATVGASELLLGAPTRSALIKLLRGNIVRDVADILPDDIRLLVAA